MKSVKYALGRGRQGPRRDETTRGVVFWEPAAGGRCGGLEPSTFLALPLSAYHSEGAQRLVDVPETRPCVSAGSVPTLQSTSGSATTSSRTGAHPGRTSSVHFTPQRRVRPVLQVKRAGPQPHQRRSDAEGLRAGESAAITRRRNTPDRPAPAARRLAAVSEWGRRAGPSVEIGPWEGQSGGRSGPPALRENCRAVIGARVWELLSAWLPKS